MVELETLLASIRKRQAAGQYIGLASSYLATLVPCLSNDACGVKFFKAEELPRWEQAIKEATNKLVYRHPDMTLEGGIILQGGGTRSFGEKKIKEVSPGACMDFEAIITTKSKDRDGDVLESGGAEPDEKMPLLWQHMPMMPIGRMVEVTARNKQRVAGHFSIVDSELGRDSAQLVEFGALRISHGFLPLEYEPLQKDGDGDGGRVMSGWHVLRFKILETSLVSIPSNEEAIITAWSRGKLHHPLVKSWAESMKRRLPASVRSGWQGPGRPIEIHLNISPDGTASMGNGQKCACGGQGERATTDEHKCPDCKVKLDEEGKCPKCGKTPDKSPAWEGLKPFPSEHSCRLKNPGDFKPNSFRRTTRKHEDKTYAIIMGKLKDGDDSMVEQAYRYPKDSWKPDEAKAHCKDHEGGTFEAARDGEEATQPVPKALEVLTEVNRKGLDLEPFRYLIGWEVTGIRYRQPAQGTEDAAGLAIEARQPLGDPERLSRALLGMALKGELETVDLGTLEKLAGELKAVVEKGRALAEEKALGELLGV
jgi:hypothetical protein